ncbi:MAG: ATP-binding protein [Mycobacteriales bacterium]
MRAPRRWGHWTLRARLVVAIAVLTGTALVAADAAGWLLLRDQLTNRLDRQLRLTSRLANVAVTPGTDQQIGSKLRSAAGKLGQRPAADTRVYFYDADGRLAASLPAPSESRPRLGAYRDLAAHAGDGPYTVADAGGGASWRVKVTAREQGGLVVAALSLDQVEATSERLLAIDAVVTALVLLFLGAAAAWVVRLGMRPLTRMERTATQIADGDLSLRVPDADPYTEAGRLGSAMNVMLTRVQSEMAARVASEQRLRQFLADASHELRTPLTSIRGFAELSRRNGAAVDPAVTEAIRLIEDEAARMGLLVDDLLLLARLNEERPIARHPVDLLAVAADTVRDAHARSPDRRVRLAALDDRLVFEPVTVLGDEPRLRQVAANLVVNALVHTPPDAEVVVRVGAEGAEAVLEVADTGPGVPPEHAERIFERFHRVGPEHSRKDGGTGLGLPIVAAITAAHGGRVELVSAPGRGATFRVVLPVPSSL